MAAAGGRRRWYDRVRVLDLLRRFSAFLVVGAVGFGVNQGALYLLVERGILPPAWASPIAIALSMVVTFLLNASWTWRDRGRDAGLKRAGWYVAINTGGLLINWGVLVVLERAGLHYLWANVVGAAAAAFWNFALNHRVTWAAKPLPSADAAR
jgi:putative flippase GtrA